jgi:hypothetical protein
VPTCAVIEGVGVGAAKQRLIDALVWVQADQREAERRSLARVGKPGGPRTVRVLRAWMAEEEPFQSIREYLQFPPFGPSISPTRCTTWPSLPHRRPGPGRPAARHLAGGRIGPDQPVAGAVRAGFLSLVQRYIKYV